MTAGVGEAIPRIVGAHPGIRSVSLAGSRARGDATEWSDWDFLVEADDFPSVASVLPSLVGVLRPLVTLWDRLAPEMCYMLIVDGPTKIDLIFPAEQHDPEPPYIVTAETLPAIDAHFWDWTLWLTSKAAKGMTDLVTAELDKMTWYLLGPLGVTATPSSLRQAADLYLAARDEHERRFGSTVPRQLGDQVVRRIRDQESPG